MNAQPLRSRTVAWQVLIGLVLLWLSSVLHAATLTATVDRTTISSNETFTLTLQIDTRSALGQPDLSLPNSQPRQVSLSLGSHHAGLPPPQRGQSMHPSRDLPPTYDQPRKPVQKQLCNHDGHGFPLHGVTDKH